MLSPTENSRIQGLFKALSHMPIHFKADLIFKDFSRKPSKFKYFSSLCKPCRTWVKVPNYHIHGRKFKISKYSNHGFNTLQVEYHIKISKSIDYRIYMYIYNRKDLSQNPEIRKNPKIGNSPEKLSPRHHV